jgi:Ca-activated chloride channel family protein
MLNNMEFQSPFWFWLLLSVPPLVWYYFSLRRKKNPVLKFSNGKAIRKLMLHKNGWVLHIPFILRMAALVLIIFALARPRHGISEREIITEGIDIVITMDVSTSMMAEDFKPNRLEAAKKVAENFIGGRETDRIGLVIFAGQAFTQAPLTLDYEILKESIEAMRPADKEWDGTAIGMGLATAVNRLREGKSKNKVMILLTAGENNAGKIDPKTAANLAKDFNIRVYTIGVGSRGIARIPVVDPRTGIRRYYQQRVSIDEDLLRDIAAGTGGHYYRATDNSSLKKIFKEIDSLEKNKFEVKEYTNFTERFNLFLIPALLLLLLELILRRTWLRRIP